MRALSISLLGTITILISVAIYACAYPAPIEHLIEGTSDTPFAIEDRIDLLKNTIDRQWGPELMTYMLSMKFKLLRAKYLIFNRLSVNTFVAAASRVNASASTIHQLVSEASVNHRHVRYLDYSDIVQMVGTISVAKKYSEVAVHEIASRLLIEKLDNVTAEAGLFGPLGFYKSCKWVVSGNFGETTKPRDRTIYSDAEHEVDLAIDRQRDEFLTRLMSNPSGPVVRPYPTIAFDLLKYAVAELTWSLIDLEILWWDFASPEAVTSNDVRRYALIDDDEVWPIKGLFPVPPNLSERAVLEMHPKIAMLSRMAVRKAFALLKKAETPNFAILRAALLRASREYKSILERDADAGQGEMETDFAGTLFRQLPEEVPIDLENWTLIDTMGNDLDDD